MQFTCVYDFLLAPPAIELFLSWLSDPRPPFCRPLSLDRSRDLSLGDRLRLEESRLESLRPGLLEYDRGRRDRESEGEFSRDPSLESPLLPR